MDPTLTPTPGLGGPQAQQASAVSASSPRRCPQQSNYPLSTDNKTGNHPMSHRDSGNAPAITSQSRTEPPAPVGGDSGKPSKAAKRRRNRNRKRQNRQQSFAVDTEDTHERSEGQTGTGGVRESMEGDRPRSKDRPSFFTLRRNLSNTSLESGTLLDHR